MLCLEPPIPLLLLRSRRLSFVAAGVGSRGPALTCHGPAWAFVGFCWLTCVGLHFPSFQVAVEVEVVVVYSGRLVAHRL